MYVFNIRICIYTCVFIVQRFNFFNWIFQVNLLWIFVAELQSTRKFSNITYIQAIKHTDWLIRTLRLPVLFDYCNLLTTQFLPLLNFNVYFQSLFLSLN